jgi:glutathione S-transferase
MSSTMTLYQSNASPNSRRVRLYLAEKGISIPVVPVDVSKKEQFSDAYAAINPRRLVPTLVLGDGTSIGEVLALAISRGVVKVRKINQNP